MQLQVFPNSNHRITGYNISLKLFIILVATRHHQQTAFGSWMEELTWHIPYILVGRCESKSEHVFGYLQYQWFCLVLILFCRMERLQVVIKEEHDGEILVVSDIIIHRMSFC